jgi:hypothetical protein
MAGAANGPGAAVARLAMVRNKEAAMGFILFVELELRDEWFMERLMLYSSRG